MAPPDILILLCDTARADAFRPWGGPVPSPTVERLAREGTVFRRAASTAPWTLPSTASIFTGLLPTEHRITAEWVKPRAGAAGRAETDLAAATAEAGRDERAAERPQDRVPWLPQSLTDRGYRCWAVSCNPWVASWMGFGRGFEGFEDVRPWPGGTRSRLSGRIRRVREMGNVDHGGRRALSAFRRWMADGGDRPRFAFVNLMELHDPYDPPPRFHPLRRAGGLRRHEAPRALLQQLRQRHLRERPSRSYLRTIRALYYGSARYEDRLLAGFVRAVEERGRPAVVVVVSDHGENLGEHGLFEHHSSLHQTLLHVPLAVWGHRLDLAAGEVDEPVSLLALRPWLEAVAAGGDGRMAWEGPIVSEYESTVERPQVVRRELGRWLAEGDPDRVPALYHHPGIAVRDGRYKYVAVATGQETLHDLEVDPGERRDVAGEHPEVMTGFRSHREAWLDRRSKEGVVAEARSDDEQIEEHLRMLGYIE